MHIKQCRPLSCSWKSFHIGSSSKTARRGMDAQVHTWPMSRPHADTSIVFVSHPLSPRCDHSTLSCIIIISRTKIHCGIKTCLWVSVCQFLFLSQLAFFSLPRLSIFRLSVFLFSQSACVSVCLSASLSLSRPFLSVCITLYLCLSVLSFFVYSTMRAMTT